jgi:integrase
MPKKLNNALTPLTVKNAAPGRYADGGGLHLLVKPSGARSWVYRFTIRGKSRDVGLGAAGPTGISLAAARDARDLLRTKVRSGIDPIEERKQEAHKAAAAAQQARVAEITFRAVADLYIKANEESWRNAKHRQQWHNTLATYIHPVIGNLPVGEVGTAHVLLILEPIWKEKPETASRIRGRIETVLDAAKARGYRRGENPARWRGHLEQILPSRSRLTRGHHKAMPYNIIPTFISTLQRRDAVAALALEFTILTCARTSEVTGAKWTEIDLDNAVWTIPADRMKSGKEHRVPISLRTAELLQSAQLLHSDWLFPAARGGSLSSMAMAMLLRRMDANVTVHGFRSGFRDWAAECTGYAHEVCEMALAHTVGSTVERAYRRGDLFDKRRRLMDEWAAFCTTDRFADGSNVQPIRGAA